MPSITDHIVSSEQDYIFTSLAKKAIGLAKEGFLLRLEEFMTEEGMDINVISGTQKTPTIHIWVSVNQNRSGQCTKQ